MNLNRTTWVAMILVGAALLSGCERPPIDTVQTGFRGTGMELVYNPRTLEKTESLHQAPAALDPADKSGPRARQVYQNVKVLGDLSVGEFTRVMVSMTQWIAPEQGCGYCHNLQNFADDSMYTKVVARRMTQMTQHLNASWKNHVADTGVTCYTCHRGQAVPNQVWFAPDDSKLAKGMLGQRNGQNEPAGSVGGSSLPKDPFTAYLQKDTPIRQISQTALPQGINSTGSSTQMTEATYGLMMHMSTGLGVNCAFCHNSRNFSDWKQSPPQRVTAYHGIRMVRELNNEFITPLTSTFPRNRLGPKGDVAKVNCATCHQGAYKPLYGEPMAKLYPELQGPAAKLVKTTLADRATK
ncbi:MAG: photosynthetic reaction center cytochrome PufC [Burkholderiales bacterium]|jgi:photosynthetic reaction center cytochrome c subunit|nr:photosynthetic reaction center cytochrome c subunit [Betaproteobacteria bacterium]NBT83664.1 photosynthetic reaction center cytochrome c subunit [Betaproteobacteria bacterium]